MDMAKVGTADVASMLSVSRAIVYRWLDGQSIPAEHRIKDMAAAGLGAVQAYAAWWAENPNHPSIRSRSSIDKERIRKLLEDKSERDPNTGCKIYCGAWPDRGPALVRIGRRTYSVQMAALWVAGEVELYDKVYAYRTCKSPACWARRHIKVAAGVAEGLEAMRRKGIVVPQKKRGIYLTERRREAVKILLEEGRTPKQIAEDTGVNERLIRAIGREREQPA
jgi:hypothetical protein